MVIRREVYTKKISFVTRLVENVIKLLLYLYIWAMFFLSYLMCFVVRQVSNYTTITVGTCNYLLALSFVTPRANVIFKSMLCSLKAGGQGSTKIKGGGVLWERKGPFGYRYLFSRDLKLARLSKNREI